MIARLEPVISEMEREGESIVIVGHQAVLRVIFGYLMAQVNIGHLLEQHCGPCMISGWHVTTVLFVALQLLMRTVEMPELPRMQQV